MKTISDSVYNEIQAVLGYISKSRTNSTPRYADNIRRAGNLHKRLRLECHSDNKSQASAILEYIQSGKGITPIIAQNHFGCFRLGARIYDLKKMGYTIETRLVKSINGKQFAKYYLKVD